MMNNHEAVLVSRHAATLMLTLNRPYVLNAIDGVMAERLQSALTVATLDPSIRAVILTGSGRGFCSGGDLQFAVDANPDQVGNSFDALTELLHPCIEMMHSVSLPIIAAINGPAAGAGFFLALAADVRIMAENSYLKQSNTSHGLSLPAGGTFFLPRLVGLGRALEIATLDEPITATRALELGLVSRVVPQSKLLETAHEVAARVASMPSAVLGRVKRLMNDSFSATLTEQLAREQAAVIASANSAEGREGILAFLEKRMPNYVA